MTYVQLVYMLKTEIARVQGLHDALQTRAKDRAIIKINELVATTGLTSEEYLDSLRAFLMDIEEQRRDSRIVPPSPSARGHLSIMVPFPPEM